MRPQAGNPLSNGLTITVMAAVLCGSIVLYFWLFATPLMQVLRRSRRVGPYHYRQGYMGGTGLYA